ncbi:MAG TPA: DMT family transporter [Vicinamibacteria bacterium]|nr:DMT family transporter [Vicinamibacteria bacterium]
MFLALVGFAGNSLLCRFALGAGAIDPAAFTLVRLSSGALTLALLARGRGSAVSPAQPRGSWAGASALALYAVCFSFAYVRLPAGVGALVLFAVTQATMIGWGMHRGDRPGARESLGIAVALAGLVGLAAPGRTAPDAEGVALMAVAGVGWGSYSLLGRNAGDPLVSNARAFARAAVPAALVALLLSTGPLSPTGVVLAAVSGALASGIGYSLWYAALPHLSRTRAAALQLTVPVLAAVAGVVLLGEALTLRLVTAGAVILGGVALSVLGAPSSSRPGPPGPTESRSSPSH